MNQHNRPHSRLNRLACSHFSLAPFFKVGVALILGMANVAGAEPIGDISLHISTDRSEDAGTTATSERHFRLNLATGWSHEVAPDNLLGYGISFRTERGLQSGSELAGYGVGVFLGWYNGPFSLRLDYVALSELKSNNGVNETAFRDGSGVSLQARWIHWFGETTADERTRRIGFGPSLAFEQIKYAKSRVGSLPETSNNRVTESLMPGFAGVFLF